MSLEELAEKPNAEKVPTIHDPNRGAAGSVREPHLFSGGGAVAPVQSREEPAREMGNPSGGECSAAWASARE